jgi:hypothetical protein
MNLNNGKKPMDIVTIYNSGIMDTYNEYSKKMNEGNITIHEQLNYLSFLVELYRKENRLLNLAVYDKYDNRYMNYLCANPIDTVEHNDEDHINQLAHFFLSRLKGYFLFHDNKNPLVDLPEREAAILQLLFTNRNSLEIINRNELGYDKYVNYKFYNETENLYCAVLLELIKEIAIRTYNYEKHIHVYEDLETTYQDVLNLYEVLAIQGIKDREYANKSIIGKTLQKIDWEIYLRKNK